MKLKLSDRAKTHYREIEIYTVENFGARQWLVYSAQIEQGFSTLRRFPGIGVRPAELSDGIHAFRVQSHWICCEIMGDTILIHAFIKNFEAFSDGQNEAP